MGGGNRHEVFNYRERLVSGDFNRAQQFAMQARAEVERMRANDTPIYFRDSGAGRSMASLPAAIAAPLRADIHEGLCVSPVVGSWSLFVTPGTIGMHDPDGVAGSSDPAPASLDDSPYKMVVDPGISALDELVIAPNLAAFTRIDTIECQRTELVTEQENRDIYNPATRTFTPALKDKVSTGRLAYRVRQGVAGAGMPAPVQGWLPLAVVRVPITAVSTDDCTFWDVRTVVRDRAFSPYRDYSSLQAAPLRNNLGYADAFTTAGKTKVQGVFTGEAYPGILGGGTEFKGAPGVDVGYVDARDTDNHEPGFALGAHGIWYLWHLFPYGLPRWVRYITTPLLGTTRIPFGPMGIPTISAKPPLGNGHGYVNPATPITIPASTELNAVCTVGLCAGAFGSDAGGVPGAAIVDGDWTWLGKNCAPTGIAPTAGAGSLVSNDWTLTAGTHFPLNARSVRVRIVFGLIGTAHKGATCAIRVFVRRNGTTDEFATSVYSESGGIALGDSGALSVMREFEIPRIPGFLADLQFTTEWNLVHAGLAKAGETCEVVGWRLSD